MSYTIGYAPRGWKNVNTKQQPNAREALKLVLALQRSDEEVRYIKAPWGGEIGLDELRMTAEQEGEG